jgi:hypothetical protein
MVAFRHHSALFTAVLCTAGIRQTVQHERLLAMTDCSFLARSGTVCRSCGIVVGEDCLRLSGGGKFPLHRMMKTTVDKMPAEERARIFDSLHRKMPELDKGTDRYTRELHKYRRRWAAEDADAQREAEAAARSKRQKIEWRASRMAAEPRPPAKLPPLSGDARNVAHALEKYVRGELGPVVPRDCVLALLRLQSLLAKDQGMCSVAVRRACVRVAGALLRHIADAVRAGEDLISLIPAFSIAVDALWHTRPEPRYNVPGALSSATLVGMREIEDDSIRVVVAVLFRLAVRPPPKISMLGIVAFEHVARAAALGAIYHRPSDANVSLTQHASGHEAEEALLTLSLSVRRLPNGALTLTAIEAILLLCSICQGGGSSGSNITTTARLPLLQHLISAAETLVRSSSSTHTTSAAPTDTYISGSRTSIIGANSTTTHTMYGSCGEITASSTLCGESGIDTYAQQSPDATALEALQYLHNLAQTAAQASAECNGSTSGGSGVLLGVGSRSEGEGGKGDSSRDGEGLSRRDQQDIERRLVTDMTLIIRNFGIHSRYGSPSCPV